MNSTHSAPALRSPFRIAGMGLLALVVVGCSGRGDVSGKVSYNGKPVVFGTVLILAKDRSHQGEIKTDGSYSVSGVAVGTVRVAVNSPNPKKIELYPNKNPEFKQDPYPDVPGWFAIPKQYEAVETSGLTYTVNGGSNTIDIELK